MRLFRILATFFTRKIRKYHWNNWTWEYLQGARGVPSAAWVAEEFQVANREPLADGSDMTFWFSLSGTLTRFCFRRNSWIPWKIEKLLVCLQKERWNFLKKSINAIWFWQSNQNATGILTTHDSTDLNFRLPISSFGNTKYFCKIYSVFLQISRFLQLF